MDLWLAFVLGLVSGIGFAWLNAWLGDSRFRRARIYRRLKNI